MKNILLLIILVLFSISGYSQSNRRIIFGETYSMLSLSKISSYEFTLALESDGIYQFSILQRGIAVKYKLQSEKGEVLLESDMPQDIDGYEKFECQSHEAGQYKLTIQRFEHPENSDSGKFDLLVKSLNKEQILARIKIKEELVPENKKNVLTLDVEHFWYAFDLLKESKTYADSVDVMQEYYLGRATDGLQDFIQAREITSEKLVKLIARYPRFYRSVRNNTNQIKKAIPMIEELYHRYQDRYPNFKPFKVCFAIGLLNTGGTVSDKFVLIGAEVATSTANLDLSEFDTGSFRSNLAYKGDIMERLETLIAHESVHTQQKIPDNQIKCPLLYQVIREGMCDFIGEWISGKPVVGNHKYGNEHERELWEEFKKEQCSKKYSDWLYNYSTVKDRPADLGYYIGYKIVQEYYKNATNKSNAVTDILEMTNPEHFLELSKYEKKF